MYYKTTKIPHSTLSVEGFHRDSVMKCVPYFFFEYSRIDGCRNGLSFWVEFFLLSWAHSTSVDWTTLIFEWQSKQTTRSLSRTLFMLYWLFFCGVCSRKKFFLYLFFFVSSFAPSLRPSMIVVLSLTLPYQTCGYISVFFNILTFTLSVSTVTC